MPPRPASYRAGAHPRDPVAATTPPQEVVALMGRGSRTMCRRRRRRRSASRRRRRRRVAIVTGGSSYRRTVSSGGRVRSPAAAGGGGGARGASPPRLTICNACVIAPVAARRPRVRLSHDGASRSCGAREQLFGPSPEGRLRLWTQNLPTSPDFPQGHAPERKPTAKVRRSFYRWG